MFYIRIVILYYAQSIYNKYIIDTVERFRGTDVIRARRTQTKETRKTFPQSMYNNITLYILYTPK